MVPNLVRKILLKKRGFLNKKNTNRHRDINIYHSSNINLSIETCLMLVLVATPLTALSSSNLLLFTCRSYFSPTEIVFHLQKYINVICKEFSPKQCLFMGKIVFARKICFLRTRSFHHKKSYFHGKIISPLTIEIFNRKNISTPRNYLESFFAHFLFLTFARQ